jgi:glycosyltransferase involved in cell wall biosynthesis
MRTNDRPSTIPLDGSHPQPRVGRAEGPRRPKLLFLAWNFPPVQAVASLRTWNIAKYLTRLGWDVTVVTPKLELWRHIDNPEKVQVNVRMEGIRQIWTDHSWRFLSPIHLSCWNQGLGWFTGGACRRLARMTGIDDAIGWIKAAERACSSLRPDDVDLILASGPPFSTFTLAEKFSKNLRRPYFLDYRDPLMVADIIQPFRPLALRREARLLSGAAGVTIVSDAWSCDLNARFNVGSKLKVVTNGYDPEEVRDVKPHDFGHFAIVYAGIFYPPERVITPVFSALKRLENKQGKSREWYFHYYGDHNQHVREEAARFGVADRVRLHGRVPRSEALSAIRGANIALVINSVFEEAPARIKGWVPAKLFEIIALETPILLIAPSGTDAETIALTSGPTGRFSGNDILGIQSFIDKLMEGCKFETGTSDSFAWKQIGASFDAYLRGQLLSPRR